MKEFKVGDKVMMYNHKKTTWRNGKVATIVEGLKERLYNEDGDEYAMCYKATAKYSDNIISTFLIKPKFIKEKLNDIDG